MKNILKRYRGEIVIGVISLLIIIGFISIVASLINFLEELEEKTQQERRDCERMNESEKITIYSLNLSSINEGYVNGGFTFTRGSYKDESYYTFYQIMDDGGKMLIKIPTENSTLYNDENDGPYILENTTCSVGESGDPAEKKEYLIHIPENALLQEYDGNLSNLK